MIDPQQQWAIQIEVTNTCQRKCSNCTRLLTHAQKPFFIPLEAFEQAVIALANFSTNSLPNQTTPERKVIGMLGGEPLLHPQFRELCGIFTKHIPNREHRGLWTGICWKCSRYNHLIQETFGYINNNQHNQNCLHSPILVAIQDVEPDLSKRKELINRCWLQEKWSGSITPKGFFFCEVAGAMDLIFNGPGGLPIEPNCWQRPLKDFQYQIDLWCHRCGIPLQLSGRKDTEEIDDVSTSNLIELAALNSPRILAGEYKVYEPSQSKEDQPWQYLR